MRQVKVQLGAMLAATPSQHCSSPQQAARPEARQRPLRPHLVHPTLHHCPTPGLRLQPPQRHRRPQVCTVSEKGQQGRSLGPHWGRTGCPTGIAVPTMVLLLAVTIAQTPETAERCTTWLLTLLCVGAGPAAGGAGGPPDMSQFGVGGLGGLGSGSAAASAPQMSAIIQAMQNPAMQQAMQQMMSTPGMMEQMLNMNPQMRAAVEVSISCTFDCLQR